MPVLHFGSEFLAVAGSSSRSWLGHRTQEEGEENPLRGNGCKQLLYVCQQRGGSRSA